jgi:hypothetical protein
LLLIQARDALVGEEEDHMWIVDLIDYLVAMIETDLLLAAQTAADFD